MLLTQNSRLIATVACVSQLVSHIKFQQTKDQRLHMAGGLIRMPVSRRRDAEPRLERLGEMRQVAVGDFRSGEELR
jgi:hypothetical protein